MTYKYEEPDGKKYTVSVKEWNKVFAERGKWPLIKVEVYVQDDKAISHYVVSNTGKVIILLLSLYWWHYITRFSRSSQGF